MYKSQFVSVVIPALDEEEAITKVVASLNDLRNQDGTSVIDEIIVCDNGSTDDTATNAQQAGAKVVYQSEPGYGIACLTAMQEISHNCDIVLFVDGDDSCYAHQAMDLLELITLGHDLAIGSRVKGNIEKYALTPVQRFGNALASFLIRTLWREDVTDLGPFRAIRKTCLDHIHMEDKTFGWTIEMQIKCIQAGLSVHECAVDSKQRIGVSKISGTIKGSIKAGIGILGMIARLWWRQLRRPSKSIIR